MLFAGDSLSDLKHSFIAPGKPKIFLTLHVMGRNLPSMCKFIVHRPCFCLDLSELWGA